MTKRRGQRNDETDGKTAQTERQGDGITVKPERQGRRNDETDVPTNTNGTAKDQQNDQTSGTTRAAASFDGSGGTHFCFIFYFERTRPTAKMTPACLIYHSTIQSNEADRRNYESKGGDVGGKICQNTVCVHPDSREKFVVIL